MELLLIFHFLWTDLYVTYAYNDLAAGILSIVLIELKTIKQIITASGIHYIVCSFRLTTFKTLKKAM